MSVSSDVDYDELSRSAEGFNGAQCRAVCIEAGMIAVRKNRAEIIHNDFIEGISEDLSKKKSPIHYFT
jgi:26S proteasome regulatory subunit T5